MPRHYWIRAPDTVPNIEQQGVNIAVMRQKPLLTFNAKGEKSSRKG
jgi:hypothetical protein